MTREDGKTFVIEQGDEFKVLAAKRIGGRIRGCHSGSGRRPDSHSDRRTSVLHWELELRPKGGVFAVQTQGQAFGAAARFDELSQFSCVRDEAEVCQVGFERRTPGIEHDVFADDHGVTGETGSLVGRHANQSWNVFGQRFAAVFVEGRRVVECRFPGEGAKAGVEVVISIVNKL